MAAQIEASTCRSELFKPVTTVPNPAEIGRKRFEIDLKATTVGALKGALAGAAVLMLDLAVMQDTLQMSPIEILSTDPFWQVAGIGITGVSAAFSALTENITATS